MRDAVRLKFRRLKELPADLLQRRMEDSRCIQLGALRIVRNSEMRTAATLPARMRRIISCTRTEHQ